MLAKESEKERASYNMTVEKRSYEDVRDEGGSAIHAGAREMYSALPDVASQLKEVYLDMSIFKSLMKNVGGSSEEETSRISETGNVIEIAFPYDMTGKYSPLFWRYHSGGATPFVQTSQNGQHGDGTFYVDESKGKAKSVIHVFSNRFSVYALTYSTQEVTLGKKNTSSGSGGGVDFYNKPTTWNSKKSGGGSTSSSKKSKSKNSKKNSQSKNSQSQNSQSGKSSVKDAGNCNALIRLNAGLKADQNGYAIEVSWGEVKEAKRYDVFAAYCGTDSFKIEKTIKTGKGKVTFSTSIEKLGGKPIDTTRQYKLYVVAYKDGKGKNVLAKSITLHLAGKDDPDCSNPKSIIVGKSQISVKKGKSAKINAKVSLVDSSKKALSNAHAPKFRYASSNRSIATVNAGGVIKGQSKGESFVYIYAQNGQANKIKVTVN